MRLLPKFLFLYIQPFLCADNHVRIIITLNSVHKVFLANWDHLWGQAYWIYIYPGICTASHISHGNYFRPISLLRKYSYKAVFFLSQLVHVLLHYMLVIHLNCNC